MRIGTASFNDSQLTQFNRLNEQIATDQGAIASGQRRAAPSDDPAAAARSARLVRAQADNARYATGLDLAEQRLGVMDTALGGVSNQLTRLKELALQASSETASPADRQAVLTEAVQIQQSLVGLANARDGGGQYLFAGARSGQPAFAQDVMTGAVTYEGLGAAAPVTIGAAAQIVSADAGNAVFGPLPKAGGRTLFGVVQDFITALQTAVPGAGAAAGTERNALAAAIDGLSAAGDAIATTRAGIGARLNRVDSERTALAANGTDLVKARSTLDDTDYAQAVTDLQKASTILTAAQKTFAQVSSLSLFNELH